MSTRSDLGGRPPMHKSDSTAHLLEELERYLLPTAKRKGKCLGEGAYGRVELLEVDGMLCAGKSIHPALAEPCNVGVKNIIERFIQECELMSKLRHTHIVQFFGVCFLPPGSRIPMLVMEYMQISLDALLQNTPNLLMSQKRSILQDVALGLSFLHSRDPPVIHRDITAKNILLSADMQAKIADLGVARILNIQPGQLEATLTRVPGTSLYMPPEAFSHNTVYNSSIDIFSLGHLMLYTVTQIFPNVVAATYVDKDGKVMAKTEVERRADTMAELQKQLGETHPFVPLITKCLSNQPADRPSAREVMKSLIEMKFVIPDPYAAMTRLQLIQKLTKMEAEVSQQEEKLRKAQEEREWLMDTIAGLNRRIEELTDTKSQRQTSCRQPPGDGEETTDQFLQEKETKDRTGPEKREDPEGRLLNPPKSPSGSFANVSVDIASNRSSTSSPDPEDYILPSLSTSSSTTSFPSLQGDDNGSSDEGDMYELPPDFSPSEPKPTRPQKPFLTYVQLKPGALFFLQNNSGGRVPGVTYNLTKKSVRIERDTMKEVRKSAARFQQVYRHVTGSPDFRVTDINIPPGVDYAWIEHILIYLKAKVPRSAVVHMAAQSTIRLATISTSDFEFLKRFLPMALKNLTPISHVRPTHIRMHVHHMSHERRLTIKNSNIGGEDVHVIVNTTNSELKLSGGLGGWLNNLSLGELQNQCSLLRRQQGPVPLGKVAITGLPPGARGILKCDWVIHAIIPTTMYSEAAKMLSAIIREVISLAESKNAMSIAIPPLTAGCVGVSRHLMAQVLIGELLAYRRFRPNTLTDIRIVTPEEETYSSLVQFLRMKEGRSATVR